MSITAPATFHSRAAAAAPFLTVALLAVVAGGAVAAAVAHAPSRALVWMVAYLVLVAGVAQAAFGAGQAWLATRGLSVRLVVLQWAFFNLGNAGVITGTLMSTVPLVASGTAAFVMALLLFLAGVRHARRGGWLTVYRLGLGLLALGSAVGMTLSLIRSVG